MSQFFMRNITPFGNPLRSLDDSAGTHPAASAKRVKWALLALGLLILVLALSAPLAARAQEDVQPGTTRVVTDDEVNAIANKLFCPVCENITLDTCGTAACDDWRYEIRLQLEQGYTEAQIVEDFVRRFGDRVVGTPLDPTLRAISLYTPWLLVAAALIASGVVLMKRRTSKPTLAAANGAAVSPARDRYADLFEQDLSN